jgi:hypothetical protein
MIRDFLAAGRVDHMHIVVVPILLGPRRTPLGRTGGPREGLSGRGHLLAQRSHACDVHPCGCLNRAPQDLGPEILRLPTGATASVLSGVGQCSGMSPEAVK